MYWDCERITFTYGVCRRPRLTISSRGKYWIWHSELNPPSRHACIRSFNPFTISVLSQLLFVPNTLRNITHHITHTKYFYQADMTLTFLFLTCWLFVCCDSTNTECNAVQSMKFFKNMNAPFLDVLLKNKANLWISSGHTNAPAPQWYTNHLSIFLLKMQHQSLKFHLRLVLKYFSNLPKRSYTYSDQMQERSKNISDNPISKGSNHRPRTTKIIKAETLFTDSVRRLRHCNWCMW